MKKTIGSQEAKINLSSLLDKVAEGQSFTITKREKPIAILSPVPLSEYETLEGTVDQIKELRKKFRLGNLGIKKIISKGRH